MENIRWTLVIVIFHVFFVCEVTSGPVCLFCQETVDPTDCDTVEQCGDHQQCFVDSFVTFAGGVRYSLGCRDTMQCKGNLPFGNRRSSGMLICSECCKDTLCNNMGCGSTGYLTQRGPICYNCAEQYNPVDCSKITVCGEDEVCLLQKVITGASHNVRYQTRCEIDKICQNEYDRYQQISPSLVGKRNIGHCNIQCCNTDICNDNCSSPTTTGTTGKATITASGDLVTTGSNIKSTVPLASTILSSSSISTSPATTSPISPSKLPSSSTETTEMSTATTAAKIAPTRTTAAKTTINATAAQWTGVIMDTAPFTSSILPTTFIPVTNIKNCADQPGIDCNILNKFWAICSDIRAARPCLRYCNFC